MKREEIDKILEGAQELYNEGKWQDARIKLLEARDGECSKEQLSKKYRILGWCLYYIGKKNLEDPQAMGEDARESFEKVIDLGVKEDVNSALAGLPLVYQYLLGDVQKAIETAEKRVDEASDSRTRAIALNSLGCIQRDAGLIKEALESFRVADAEVLVAGDLRTRGHIWNNKARTLMSIIPWVDLRETKRALKEEVRRAFKKALALYKTFEDETSQSAEFHKKGIYQKLEELERL